MNVGFDTVRPTAPARTRLRILHCLRAPVGGLFRHVCDLSAALARRGHAVGIICDASASDALTAERLAGLAPWLSIGLYKVPMSRHVGLMDIAAYRAIRLIVPSLNADVLHGHGAKGGAYARLVARALARGGRPVACLYTPHGGSLHYDPASIAGRAYMAAERQLARATDAIIFESAYAAGRYADQVGRVDCPTRIVPNGLGPADFFPAEAAAEAADILFVGELRRLKGVDVLLEALARARAVRPVRATIVGDGPDANAFKAQAAALGLDGAVTFVGPMPAARAFRLGRALAVPSRAESFPYIVLEAAAAGLPLIATDVGGIPEMVAGTDTALLPAGDADALMRAILDLLDNPQAARARAQRLRAAVQQRYTIEAMTDAIARLYAACAGQRLMR
jgi:glycosyltransferase involved in cell wall biosynthesis